MRLAVWGIFALALLMFVYGLLLTTGEDSAPEVGKMDDRPGIDHGCHRVAASALDTDTPATRPLKTGSART